MKISHCYFKLLNNITMKNIKNITIMSLGNKKKNEMKIMKSVKIDNAFDFFSKK